MPSYVSRAIFKSGQLEAWLTGRGSYNCIVWYQERAYRVNEYSITAATPTEVESFPVTAPPDWLLEIIAAHLENPEPIHQE